MDEDHAGNGTASPPSDRSINYWIYALSSSISRGATRYYGTRFDISLPEMRLLSTLAREGCLASRDLASLTAMDKGMVSRVISGLSAIGYVKQIDDDRRARLRRWTLTRSGKAMVARLQPLWRDREARIQACLSEEERKQLKDMLERLFRSSEKLQAEEAEIFATERKAIAKRRLAKAR